MQRPAILTGIGLLEILLALAGLAVFGGYLADIALVKESLGDLVSFMLPSLDEAAQRVRDANEGTNLAEGASSAAAIEGADPAGMAAVQAALERPVGESAGDAWYLYARIGLSAISLLAGLLLLAGMGIGRVLAVLAWIGILAVVLIAPGFSIVAKVIPAAMAILLAILLYSGPVRAYFRGA